MSECVCVEQSSCSSSRRSRSSGGSRSTGGEANRSARRAQAPVSRPALLACCDSITASVTAACHALRGRTRVVHSNKPSPREPDHHDGNVMCTLHHSPRLLPPSPSLSLHSPSPERSVKHFKREGKRWKERRRAEAGHRERIVCRLLRLTTASKPSCERIPLLEMLTLASRNKRRDALLSPRNQSLQTLPEQRSER